MKDWKDAPATERQQARIAWWCKRLGIEKPSLKTKGEASDFITNLEESHSELEDDWQESPEREAAQRAEVYEIVKANASRYQCKKVSKAKIDKVIKDVGLRDSEDSKDVYASKFFDELEEQFPELFRDFSLPPRFPSRSVQRLPPPIPRANNSESRTPVGTWLFAFTIAAIVIGTLIWLSGIRP